MISTNTKRLSGAGLAIVAGFAWMSGARSQTPAGSGQPSTKNGEWPMYTADLRGSKYSPLDQINADNFNKLEVAWRFKTDSLGPRAENKLEGTPIMVKGMVYATAGTRRAVVALDAKTGELKWVYSLDEGKRAARSPVLSPAVVFLTGPTAKATTASCSSLSATGSWN